MSSKISKVTIAACAAVFGITSAARATSIIENGNTSLVGGWNVTVPTGISVTVDSSDKGVLVLEKTANFTNSTSLAITFQQVAPGATPQVEFQDEAVTNNTGSDWSSFSFVLTPNATFAGVGDVFVPAIGTGVDYTTVSLNSAKDTLTYGGTQANGSIANWGDSNPAHGLLINANPGTTDSPETFTFTESANSGGGGGTVVPMPAAFWQSLLGLTGLGIWFTAKKALPKLH